MRTLWPQAVKAYWLTIVFSLSLATPVSAAAVVSWGDNYHAEGGAGYASNYNTLPVGVVGLGAVKQLSTSYQASIALLPNGSVWSWGIALGLPVKGKTYGKPVPGPFSSGVAEAVYSGGHGIARMSNGTVETWGGDWNGEMGNGTIFRSTKLGIGGNFPPTPVAGIHEAVEVAAAGGNDAVRLSNGEVLMWGEDNFAQLGEALPAGLRTTPAPVKGLSGVAEVKLGGGNTIGGFALARLSNGTVASWGDNIAGRLGDGVSCKQTHGCLSAKPVQVKGLTGIVQLSPNFLHALALNSAGVVFAWGNDSSGELGPLARETCVARSAHEGGKQVPVPCSTVPVPAFKTASEVSAGYGFSLALASGGVYAWGDNSYGTLGNGTRKSTSSPTLARELSGVTQIAAGEHTALAAITGSAPPPLLQAAPGPGSIALTWRSAPTKYEWLVRWRSPHGPHPKKTPWGAYAHLPPSARSYTIAGLTPGARHQVEVKSVGWETRLVGAMPLD